jgi:cell wall-associated NlpC family hydrolase
MALAAATTLAVTLPVAGVANAAPDPRPAPTHAPGKNPGDAPSKAQVDRAKSDVASKKQSVAQIQAALDAAATRMQAASTAAEAAAESYNGAVWRLEEARKATRKARLDSRRAAAAVTAQRDGIMQLVTESYQNGTELNTATALMSDEGPQGVMNRYGVVQSAGDSMKARYDRFTTASARAKRLAGQASKAQDHQAKLATEAKGLAAQAGQAAAAAGAAANQIATQKQQLMRELAAAQNISVDLATRRHDALEAIAARKAAAAARAKQAAEQAALAKAAAQAKRKAAAAKADKAGADRSAHDDAGDAPTTIVMPAPVAAPPPVANPAPNQNVAVKRAIAYAKQQLGLPYQWAASGPGTFDCSGLTMMAWARGGKALPHYSVAQFFQSTRVTMADARPGDLLFWSNNGSPSGIHHVALYLGGGQFIEAPHTGAFVRYNSISNWYPDFVARP